MVSFDREGPEGYLAEMVERLESLSFKEALSHAIPNEEDGAKYYAELAQKAKRRSVKTLFSR